MQVVAEKPIRFMLLDEVIARVRLGKTAIYDRIKIDQFPKQIKIGTRKSAWLESEIEQFMLELAQARPEFLDDEL